MQKVPDAGASSPRMHSRMRSQRIKRGLTQEQLAFLVGCTRETIRNIENGRHVPSVLLATQISRELGSLEWSKQ